ncbi:MAG: hypothetical protein JWR25_2235 [Noviherbaspirillum sp.]|nr:hypothetical protein [Noviherbaspirillum sp.]
MATKRPSAMELMLGKKTEGMKERIDNRVTPSISDRPPVTMPGQLGAFRLEAKQYQEKIVELETQLKRAKEAGGALEVGLDQLVEVEGRRRQLTPGAYAELKENLRQHDLITPITVRVLDGERYEIMSGHNRVAVYRELGRKSIKAWLADSDADKSEELSFYANLLHPDLSAYEKYCGLKRIMDSAPQGKLTQQELAQRTGIARTTIAELLKFDDLPEEAKALLSEKPDAIGARTAAKMAALAASGNSGQVTAALMKVVREGITESEAIQLATAAPQKARVSNAGPITVKSGRSTYCTVRPASKMLRIDFQFEEDRAEVEAKILEVLEQQASRKKEMS